MYQEQKIKDVLAALGTETPFDILLRETGERLLFTLGIAEELKEDLPADRLKEICELCQQPLIDKAYESGFANPAKAVAVFGEEMGRFVSVFSYRIFTLYTTAYYSFNERLQQGADTWLKAAIAGEDHFMDALRECWQEIRPDVTDKNFRLMLDPDMAPSTAIALTAASGNPAFMYRYGVRITDNDLKTAEFVNSLSEQEISLIADTMVEAYIEGFVEDAKDYSTKNTIGLMLQAGFERLLPHLIEKYDSYGLRAYVMRVSGTDQNKQATYDHRFDYSLYLNEKMVEEQLAATEHAYENIKVVMHDYSGVALLRVFGEAPFSPVPKPEACKADEETSAIYNQLMQKSSILRNKYVPRDETSFVIIAFPSPEIEGNFHEIFKETVEVNTLSNSLYRPVQQSIVDAMDGAALARVKGSGSNETDLTISLCPLNDPETETAFINCLASVNIPVGEVFTSPVLKGTNGVLHVEESFLGGLRYDNIRLSFKDGYLDQWSCDNFDTPEKGKEYIHENLIFPHKTLPLGEFAIGTNTLAYEMALKHRIMDILPVLILEKMGPHFAIGDTCFSWEEDSRKPCPVTGKTMVAVDNEQTLLRKEDPAKAYTNKHTDVTLPYSSLDYISAVHPDGREVFIIKNGKFVLPGTEFLNEAIERAHTC